jgi:hypothetical protein
VCTCVTEFSSFFSGVPDGSGERESPPLDSSDVSSPEALALMGAVDGHSKRKNPQTYKGGLGRVRNPLRRTSGSLHGVDLHGKGKGKKGSISSIFQTSITALSFLAFGGYLLCLIVQAIRAKNNGMGTMNGAALQANLSRFVFIGRRPTSGKRRKRDSTGKENSRTLEGPTRRESTHGNVSDALLIHYGDKHDTEPGVTDEMELSGLDARTITAVRKTFGSNDKQEFSEGTENSRFNQTEEEVQSDEETVEMSEDHAHGDVDNAEEMHQAQVYREDVVQLGLWPLANVDDMYRALLMIAEGYSQYHQEIHTN